MNKIYRLVWNRALGTWVAVSEITKSKTKSSRSRVQGQTTNSNQVGASHSHGKRLPAIATGVVAMMSLPQLSVAAIGIAGGFGAGTGATSISSLTCPTQSQADGIQAIAIGCGAVASGLSSIAFGVNTNASGNNSGVVGSASSVAGNNAYVIGNNNNVSVDNTFAIGNNITANTPTNTVNGNVILGNASSDKAYQDVLNGTINGRLYSYVGTATGVVSVGGIGTERQIVNVAPGAVSATSTDAVNGSQLFQSNVEIANLASKTANAFGGGSTAGTATGGITAPSYTINKAAGGGSYSPVNNVASALTNLNTEVVRPITFNGNSGSSANQLGSTLNIQGGALTAGTYSSANTKTVVTGNTLNVQLADAPVFAGTLTANGLNANGQQVSNVGPAVAGTDAVNLNQLNASLSGVGTHYFSVNSTLSGAGTNYSNNGATGSDAIAIGLNAAATTSNGVAIGSGAQADSNSVVAIGFGAGQNSTAAAGSPTPTTTNSAYSVYVGENAGYQSAGNFNTMVGSQNAGRGLIGYRNSVYGSQAGVAYVGNESTLLGNYAGNNGAGNNNTFVGFGAGNTATGGNDNVALGQTAFTGSSSKGTALGAQAAVASNNSVALGAGSFADGSNLSSNAYLTNQVANAEVSIGGVNQLNPTSPAVLRRITNVAGGAADNDAVNVAQLKVVSAAANAGWNLQANGDTASQVKPGDTVQLLNGQNIAITRSGNNVTVATTPELTATKTTVGGVVTDGTTNTITGLAAGALSPTSTDAVNGSQLYTTNQNVAAVQAQANAGLNITSNGSTSSDNVKLGETINFKNTDGNLVASHADNSVNYDLAPDIKLNSVTTGGSVLNGTGLTITGGPSLTTAGIDAGSKVITNVAAGVAPTDAANVSQLNAISAVANTGWNLQANGDTASQVKPGDTVQLLNGQNIAITRSGNNVTVATTPELTATKTTVGGVVTDGTTNTITGLAAGALSPTSTDAVNGSQLYTTNQNVAAVQAQANAGLNITSNGSTSSDNVKLGETINFKNTDGNLVASHADNSVNYDLAPDIKLNSVTTGGSVLNGTGLTITGGPSLTTAGIDAGSKVITNVAAGVAPTDAANVSQLNAISAVANTGWNLQANGDTASQVKPGDTVQLLNGQNIAITRSGNNVTVATTPELTATKTTVGGVVTDGTTNTITGLAAGALSPTSTDAVNGSQLYTTNQNVAAVQAQANAGLNITSNGSTSSDNVKLGETINFKNTDGNLVASHADNSVNYDLAPDIKLNSVTTGGSVLNGTGLTITGGPSLTTAGIDAGSKVITNVAAGVAPTDAANVSQLNAISAVANTGWNLQANGDTASQVKPGDTVQLLNGQNIAITRSGNNVTVATTPELTATKTTVGGVVTDGTTNTITGLAAGALSPTSTDAVNGSQLYTTNQNVAAVQAQANAGLNITSNGSTSSDNVKLGETINFKNTDGNLVASHADNSVNYDLAPDIKLNSVTTGGSVLNGTGLTITGGPSLTTAGIDAGSKVITNVAAGVAPTDAANVSQLNAISATANAGWTLSSGTTTQQIKPNSQVAFAGDNNVTISQTNTVDGAKLNLALNPDISLNSVTTGQTVISNAGIQVGSAVQLGTTGLVLADGPSVTTAGIDAGSKIITNVAAGQQQTDAVNVGQLNNAIGGVNNQVQQLSANAVKYDVNPDGTINKGQVTLEGAGGTTLSNVKAGELSATSTQAVNGSQLFATNQQVAQNTSDINNIQSNIANITNGTAGLVQQQGGSQAPITVGAATGGTTINVTGRQGTRQITGVSAGTVSSTSTDAINGSQLYTANQNVASALGGGAGVGTDGQLTAPTYQVDGTAYHDVGSALGAVQQASNNNINNLNTKLNQAFYSTNERITKVEKRANAGIASVLSMENAPYIPGKFTYGVGAGFHGGEQAVGATLRRTADNGRWSLSGGVAGGTEGGASVRIGLSGVID